VPQGLDFDRPLDFPLVMTLPPLPALSALSCLPRCPLMAPPRLACPYLSALLCPALPVLQFALAPRHLAGAYFSSRLGLYDCAPPGSPAQVEKQSKAPQGSTRHRKRPCKALLCAARHCSTLPGTAALHRIMRTKLRAIAARAPQPSVQTRARCACGVCRPESLFLQKDMPAPGRRCV